MHTEVEKRIEQAGVIAVVMIDSVDVAVPLAAALYKGGVTAIELTLRSDAALHALKSIRSSVPEMLVGAGTVLTPEQVSEVHAAGAHFAVAPGCNPRVVKAARDLDLFFAPGVCTPTDVELAVELGCRVMKFFPAELSGGLPYLQVIAAPFRHLGVRYIPLAGVDPANAATYLSDPNMIAVGGSWLAPADVIAAGDWSRITKTARAAAKLVREIRTP